MRRSNKSDIRRRRVNEDTEDETTETSVVDDPKGGEQKSQEDNYFIHGEVYFSQDPREIAKFMVVPSEAEVKDVLGKFKSYWGLGIPRVALFVVSDPSRRFAWKDSYNMSALVSGLVNALNTIDMWIFTNGLNAGIAMEIGRGFRAELLKRQEAFFSHFESAKHYSGVEQFSYPEVALIGACGYNSLTYARSLIKFNRPIRLENGRYIYTEDTYDLNSDHTHFLVIKDKNPNDVHDILFKIADQMATSFEHHSQCNLTTSGAKHVRISEVSVLSLLLQGGLKALDYIRKYLKRKLPLVVVNGSGGLADLLSYTYYEVKNMPSGSNPAEYSEKVLKHLICVKAVAIFPSLGESSFAQVSVYEKLLQCVMFDSREESKLLTVLDTTQRSRLDKLPHHFLRALFKCKPAPSTGKEVFMKQDLHLAMDWNSPHIAMEEVLAKGTDVISTIDEQLFIRALLKPKREGFVEMFLQQGFHVHKVLSSKLLVLLFNESAKQVFFRNVILESMMGLSPDIVIGEVFIDTTLARFLEAVAGLPSFIRTKDLDHAFKDKFTTYQRDEVEEKTLVILIIWAICTYRVDLLKAIWKNSRQPIRLAIFISMVLKRINQHVYELTMKNHLKKHHIMFSKTGTDILDMYYKHVPARALSFIQEKSSVWCYKTVMDIAAFADNKYFLSHPCCQRYLDSIFMGHIRLKLKPTVFKYSMWLKILLSAFLVFPMYIWITFYVSVDDLTEWNIGKKNKDLTYVKQRFASCKDQKYTEKDEGFPGTKYAFDDTDPNAYFYDPVLHLKEINPPLLDKIYFMWTAPVTKFWVYHFVYLLYLGFFSAILLNPTCGNFKIDVAFFVWSIFIVIDNAVNVYIIRKKYRDYSLKCAIFQAFISIFFLCVFGLNRIVTRNKFMTSYHLRISMCFILLYLFYRFIWTLMPISSILGPLLFRMKRMILIDFGNFLKISLLFMVSNTIIIETLLYPDAILNKDKIFSMVRFLFTILFVTPLTDYGGENLECIPTSRNNSENSCRAGRYDDATCSNFNIWPWLFYVQYVTPMRYLLIPILYGMFAVTHRMFQEKSNEIWKFNRYRLIMEFQERLLPLPFSIISYVCIVINYFLKCCSPKPKHSAPPQESIETFTTFKHQDSSYFFRLFKKHCKTFELGENKEQSNILKEMEIMKALKEGLSHQKRIVTDLESHLMELQIGLNYTKKYLLHKSEAKELDAKTDKKVPQLLSRQNPYPHTQINRYPVPDNRVSWNIDWFMYDPVAYTLAKEYFDIELKEYVDEDLHLWMQYDLEKTSKRPKYLWNQAVVTAAGIFVNRKTWIIDKYGQPMSYRIDFEDLPRNPIGRTGLRGKGFLPRWGPNHYVYAFISSWSLTSTGSEASNLRFVAINKHTEQIGEQTTLPGGYLTTFEVYDAVQNFFIPDQTASTPWKWESPGAMISYFHSCLINEFDVFTFDETTTKSTAWASTANVKTDDKPPFRYRRFFRGYMDDPLNTDQAWLELELWHIHFNAETNLESKFKPEVHWELLDQTVLHRIQKGLVVFIKSIASSMEATL